MKQPISGIIFSFDRAMQLDAVLRSFFLHCIDPENIQLTVLYRISDKKNQAQYRILINEYPQVKFVEQDYFQRDLLSWLTDNTSNLINTIVQKLTLITFLCVARNNGLRIINNRYSRWLFLKLLLPFYSTKYKLFLVDDNIFIRDFSLTSIVSKLSSHPEALGFSLRLGKNTTYCYPLNSNQSLPEFQYQPENVLLYNWTNADLDFAYPLEVSSSIYRTNQILPLLLGFVVNNPNDLEGVLASQLTSFVNLNQFLLCFEKSVTFCNPINKVQKVTNNRAGIDSIYTPSHLSELFDSGMRIDVTVYDNFVPNACHQEVELKFLHITSSL